MDIGNSAARRLGSEGRFRSVGLAPPALFLLAVGAVATSTAAAASLLVESLLAKRVLWVAVLLAVSVSAGLWCGRYSTTASPRNSDRLPYVPRAGSPR
ncbi:hypothetical protein GCM10022285_40090 [Streptomyces tunisiensis]|uniref:Uncharacterized protein n=1 Tax=Streptomyces tunisiensis TaxID=948699 RepID=A0ABP7YS92_9ACTN